MKKESVSRAKLREQFLDVLSVDVEASSINVFLASATDDDPVPRFRVLQITQDLAEKFREVVQQVTIRLLKESATRDLVVYPYDGGSKPDPHEVEHLDLAAFAEVGDQIKPLASPVSLDLFSPDEQKFIRGIRFYVMVVQPDKGSPVYFFRSYTPKRELSRSAWFGALYEDGQFDRVRNPVFLFDDSIDCFSRDHDMFILSKSGFQQAFRFYALVARAAKESLRRIQAVVPIINFDDFAASCEGHLQKQAKLRNIAAKDYIEKITIAEIKATIEHYQLNVETVIKDGKEHLIFDPADRWVILRLLDDDYLRSLMTGHDYEATGKRVLA